MSLLLFFGPYFSNFSFHLVQLKAPSFPSPTHLTHTLDPSLRRPGRNEENKYSPEK